jgi:four helix bundle suffix protein
MKRRFIPPHGGYRDLLSYQKAEIVYKLTRGFCARFFEKGDRTVGQMVQAARSGKQNIVEGSRVSGTSKEAELKLLGVARGSLEELLADYEDFLANGNMQLWDKESCEAQYVRKLGQSENASYANFHTFCETRPAEVVANIGICLIHQANYLLDKQIRALEETFLREGGLRERMSRSRYQFQRKGRQPS